MSFCKKCGNQLNAGAQFCPRCGEPVSQPASDYQPTNFSQPVPTAPNKSKAPLFILIGIAAAVVLVIVLLLRGCGGAAYEKPVKVMLDTMISGKYDMKTAQKMVDQIPDPVIDAMIEDYGAYDTEREFVEELAGELEDMADDISEYNPSYKTTGTKKMDSDDIETLEEQYSDYIDVDLKISEAYTIKVSLYSTEDGEENKEKAELNTIKVKGKWYLDYFSMNSIF